MAPWLRSHTSMTRQKRSLEPCTAASASVSSASSVSSALWDVIISHGGFSSTPLAFRTLATLACVSREASTAVRAIFKTTKTLKIEPSTDFQDERISALARTLINTDAFANVTEVDVSENVCTDDGVSALLQAIESGALKHLTHLNLGINPISTDGIRELIRVAEGGALAQLSVLKLDYTDVDDEGVRLLGQAGERGVFEQVTVLSLGTGLGLQNFFGVDGVRALAHSIQRGAFPQLTGLDLSGTKVCAIGFRELAEAAEHNLAQLKILRLDSCDIYESHIEPDDTDFHNFFNAIQAIKRGAFAQLTSLNIDSCDIDLTVVRMLVDAIDEGALSKLMELHVSSTGVDNSSQIWLKVAGALERGRLPHLKKFSGGYSCDSEILSDCTVMLARDIVSLDRKHGKWSTGDESTDEELVTRVHRAHELEQRLSDLRRQRLSDLRRERREMDAALRRLSLRRSVRETLQPYVSPTDGWRDVGWWERKYVPLQTKFFNAALSIRSLIYRYSAYV